jgi:hypothetical protein
MWGDEVGDPYAGTEARGAGDPHANAEEFDDHGVNPPADPMKDPFSTFAIDVDTGSYALCKPSSCRTATPTWVRSRPTKS